MQALVTTSHQNAASSSAVSDAGHQGQVVVSNNRPNAASSLAISHVDQQSQAVVTTNRSLEALWEKALDHLCDEDKQHIDTLNIDKKEVLEDVIKVVEDKKKLCTLKQWKIKRRGDSVYLRDLFGNIIKWINKFKEVGDTLVQYDPTHAAIPWAAVRFLLQAATNDHQTMEAMAAALEHVTSLTARYRMVEAQYLFQHSETTQHLYDAIVRLYTAILVYLAGARRYYTRNTSSRIIKSVVQISESGLDAYLQNINAEERKVEKWIAIVNTECQRRAASSVERGLAGLNDKVSGFSDKISALTDQFKSFQMGLYSRNPDTPVTLVQILEWLDAVYTANEYERALCARLEGTCEWMFQRSVFQLWRTFDVESDVTKVLWVHGAPGFGKTILCASIIEFLRRSVEGPVCYFFCDFGDDSKRHPEAILRSWIAQLVKHSNEAYTLTLEHFRERNDHTATDLELWSLFRKLSFAILSCFFVIDGFDECLRNSQDNKKHSVIDERTKFLHQLAENLDHTGSRVLLVSRESSEIRDEFMKGWQNGSTRNESSGSREVILRNTDQISFLDYHITQADTGGDIRSFADSIVAARLPKKPEQLQEDLAQTASEKCDGMFLWIRLLYDRLSPAKNTKQLKRVISETPAGLEQAYKRDLMGITELPADDRERALSILQWVLFGCRPLTIRELTEALLVDIDDLSGSFPKEDLPDAWDEDYADETIRKPCGSLIELRGHAVDGSIAEMTVHFVHSSVKEFLLNTDNTKLLLTQEPRVMNPIHVNGIIARKCLIYLCYEELYRDHHSQKRDVLDLSKRYAFLNYGAESWHQHVISGEERSPELVDIVNYFLEPTVTRWMLFFDYIFYQSKLSQKPEEAKNLLTSSPLHIASKYNLFTTS